MKVVASPIIAGLPAAVAQTTAFASSTARANIDAAKPACHAAS